MFMLSGVSLGVKGAYGFISENTQSIKTFLSEEGGYVEIGGSTTNEGLDWSITKRRTGETRYEHVKLHEVNDLSKESHGVFYGVSVNTINKAWNNKSNGIKISGESVDTYIIPYENAGYAGRYGGQRQNLNSITIITQKNSDKLITGFPGNGYEYSLDGIIGDNMK